METTGITLESRTPSRKLGCAQKPDVDLQVAWLWAVNN